MMLKYVTAKAEHKDLHTHFGAVNTTLRNCVRLGLETAVCILIDHLKAKVYWDQSVEGLKRAAD